MIEVIEYVTEHGVYPFKRYLGSVKDLSAKSKIIQAVNKLEMGLVGNIKSVGGGLQEYKIDVGEGHRIYFYRDGQILIVLLGASSKKDQRVGIQNARVYLEDYKRQQRISEGRTKR